MIQEAGDVYKDSLDNHEIKFPRALTTLEKRGRHITKRTGYSVGTVPVLAVPNLAIPDLARHRSYVRRTQLSQPRISRRPLGSEQNLEVMSCWRWRTMSMTQLLSCARYPMHDADSIWVTEFDLKTMRTP